MKKITFNKYKILNATIISALALTALTGCDETPEISSEIIEESALKAPAAPTMSYEQLIVSDNTVGVNEIFFVQPIESGNAIYYLTRAGAVNILEYVVEYPDLTGYVSIQKAYSFGKKYILIVSTGENGASCPATTYAVAFDSKNELVTGKEEIDGCSENIESLSDGNKLIVKKDGEVSVFYNGEIEQAPRSPKTSISIDESNTQIIEMMGDRIDFDPDANPNGDDEHENKLQKKPWQDENGFVHFPDGSISANPVD